MSQRRIQRHGADTFAGPLNEVRAVSTAGGGTALTTTAGVIGLPNGINHAELIARNFTTAVVVKYALNPYLMFLKSTDQGLTFTDYSVTGQQNPVDTTGINLSSQPTFTNGGVLYIGAHVPFRGLLVDMSASVNAVVATSLAEYWNGTAWVTLAVTDGTASGGATFAQDGNMTWTVPSAWTSDFLSNTVAAAASLRLLPAQRSTYNVYSDTPFYWARITVSAALTANTKISAAFALNRSTSYAETLENSAVAFTVQKVPGGIACVEALTDAGTANLIVNAYTDNPKGLF